MWRSALLGVLLLGACTGGVTTVGPDDHGPAREGGPQPPRDRGAPGDAARSDILPHPGDPCPFAECTPDALCLGGVCLRKCSQQCNEPTSGECIDGEACYQATTFSSACFPGATASTGERCGEQVRCKPKNLCVSVNEGSPRCYLVCKFGCSGTCVKADNGCEFCIQ